MAQEVSSYIKMWLIFRGMKLSFVNVNEAM